MYFIIKYIDSIFKCYNSEKYLGVYKMLFDVGQGEVIFLINVSY